MDSRTRDQLETWRRKRSLSNTRGISTIRRSETKWVQIQHRTFAKWVSQQTGQHVDNFKVDFIDGTIFLKLMQVLSGKSVKRFHMFPKSITQRCDNVQLALDICSSEEVKLINIGAQDIAGGSIKLILGLVWCLIQRYHLNSICDKRAGSLGSREGGKDDNLKNMLIRGLNKILDKLNLRVSNIKQDWRDGMALTALVTYLAPQFNKDFMNIERDEYVSATEEAMEAAHTHLKIPRLLSSEDFISDEQDELSMITYLCYFLDPAHKDVRESYLRANPDYTPLYRPYIEPPSAKREPSPIKKLFSSYRDKLKKVKTPTITDQKFYKEPYRVQGSGSESGSPSGSRPMRVSRSEPYGRNSPSMESRGTPDGLSPPVSPFSTAESPVFPETPSPSFLEKSGVHFPASPSPSFPETLGPLFPETPSPTPSDVSSRTGTPGGVMIRHHKAIRRTSKNQCGDQKCTCGVTESCNTCAPENTCARAAHPSDSDDDDISISERDEILDEIFGAISLEDLTKEDDDMPTLQRFKRSSTTVIRNRKPKTQTSPELTESQSEIAQLFRDHEILAEYKLLCNNVSSGVYVVPSLNSIQLWNGVIFIKIGMFAEGCFKFNLYIPDDFPYSRPTLKFITPVFHPQITSKGELNLTKAFPTWTPRKDRIWHLLRYTKRCFFSVNTFDATNQAAAAVVQESIDSFRVQARICVQESIRLNYEDQDSRNKDDNNVFGGKLLNDTQLHIVKDKLLKGTDGTLDYCDMFQ